MARILNKDLSRGKLWNRQCYCHNSLSCHESITPLKQPYGLHNCDCNGKKRSWEKRTCLTAPILHDHHQDIPPSTRARTEEGLGLLQTTAGPMMQQGKPGPPPTLNGPGRDALSHTTWGRGHRQACKYSQSPYGVIAGPVPLTPARLKNALPPKSPAYPLQATSRCCKSASSLKGSFGKVLLLLHIICADFSAGCSWKSVFHSHSPHLFLGKKTTLPLSQFSPFVCKGKRWRGKDFGIVNNQSDLTASKSALYSVHGNSFWHHRRKNNSLHNK